MNLKRLLDEKVFRYNAPDFIPDDPICIPHLFSRRQDIEIMGFFAATLAWGQRKTIISKCRELIRLMDNAPYDFILHHHERQLIKLLNFRHRTFQPADLLYFISFFRNYYKKHDSLEHAFSRFITPSEAHVQKSLEGFYELFFSLGDVPQRTRKHVASPMKNSTCKRLNMFLRWMVRHDNRGVDFGLWTSIKPSQLLCPLDVHVDRVARKLGLIQSKSKGWKAVLELTDNLKKFDRNDPVKYDFALFGMGVIEKL
ncbi:MAG TPA: TIGR02757 family protein [Chitinophagales bacterium]|nr:TIGR02757 family protein [Chitinophagales bacterium]